MSELLAVLGVTPRGRRGVSEPARSLVIVAGGRSRRLGRDKPLVEIGGRTILSRILDVAAHITDGVLAVREVLPFERALRAEAWELMDAEAGHPPGSVALRSTGGGRLLIVPDPVPDLGPLAGLASGMGAACAPVCLVVAGDLPFVSRGVVDGLSESLAGSPRYDAVVPRVGGRPQPLCAAYRREVRDLADRLLAPCTDPDASSPSMMSFLEQLHVRYVTAYDLRSATDLELITRGVDSPDDLAWATRRAAGTD